MSITKIAGADEKNAKLSMKLHADSGYSVNADGYRVSANQWAAILSICEETETGKALMAAPDLLDAARYAVQQLADGDDPELDSDGDEIDPFKRLCAAIAKATSSEQS